MLKTRILAAIMVQNNLVVQSIGFNRFLPIGKLEIVIEFLEDWDVDEIVILDISARRENRVISKELIQNVSKRCFIPISAGGGITHIEQVHDIFAQGADKVVVNSALFDNGRLIEECAERFGSQSLIASIDVKKLDNGDYKVYSNSGTKMIDKSLEEVLLEIQDRGAGEVLLNSIDRDGSKIGFDLELLERVRATTRIPLVVMGGCGKLSHIVETIEKISPSGVAVGNLFHHFEHSTAITKAYLLDRGVSVRPSSTIEYRKHLFSEEGRVVN